MNQLLCKTLNSVVGDIFYLEDGSDLPPFQYENQNIQLSNARIKKSFIGTTVGAEFAQRTNIVISSLRIHIPWSALWSASSVVELHGVNVDIVLDDIEVCETYMPLSIQEQLSALEKVRAGSIASYMTSSGYSSWIASFADNLLHSVLENLVVSLTKLQVKVIAQSNEFCMSLEVLKVYKSPIPSQPIAKRCVIENLQVVISEHEILESSHCFFDMFVSIRPPQTASMNIYISPLSIVLSKPSLGSIRILKQQVDKIQFSQCVLDGVRNPRPAEFHPASFWKFSIGRVIEDNRVKGRLSWHKIVFAARHKEEYIRKYQEIFKGSAGSIADLQKQETNVYLENMENKMPASAVMYFRTLAELRLVKTHQYYGWYNRSLTIIDLSECEDEAYKILLPSTSIGESAFSSMVILESLSVKLTDVLECAFDHIELSVDMKASKVHFSMYDMLVTDLISSAVVWQSVIHPDPVLRVEGSMNDEAGIFLSPVNVVIDPGTIQRLTDFFSDGSRSVVDGNEIEYIDRLEAFETYKYGRALPLKVFSLKVEILSPTIALVNPSRDLIVSPRDALVVTATSIHISKAQDIQLSVLNGQAALGRLVAGILEDRKPLLDISKTDLKVTHHPFNDKGMPLSSLDISFSEECLACIHVDSIIRIQSLVQKIDDNSTSTLSIARKQHFHKPSWMTVADTKLFCGIGVSSTSVLWKHFELEFINSSGLSIVSSLSGLNQIVMESQMFRSQLKLQMKSIDITCDKVTLFNICDVNLETESAAEKRPKWCIVDGFESVYKFHCNPIFFNFHEPSFQAIFQSIDLINGQKRNANKSEAIQNTQVVSTYLNIKIPQIQVDLSNEHGNVASLDIIEISLESPIDLSENEIQIETKVQSIRLFDGSNVHETILWNDSPWGFATATRDAVIIVFKYNFTTSIVDIDCQIPGLRVSLSGPLIQKILLLDILPPMEDSDEPFVIPECVISFSMKEFRCFIPSHPVLGDASWNARDLIAIKYDLLDLKLKTGNSLPSKEEYIDEEGFLDPANAVDDLDIYATFRWDGFKIENWLHERNICQDIFFASVVLDASLTENGAKKKCSFAIEPSRISLSESQMDLIREALSGLDILPAAAANNKTTVVSSEPYNLGFPLLNLDLDFKMSLFELRLFKFDGCFSSRVWRGDGVLDNGDDKRLLYLVATDVGSEVRGPMLPLYGQGFFRIDSFQVDTYHDSEKTSIFNKLGDGTFFDAVFSCDRKMGVDIKSELLDTVIHLYELRRAMGSFAAGESDAKSCEVVEELDIELPTPRLVFPFRVQQALKWNRGMITLNEISASEGLMVGFEIQQTMNIVKNDSLSADVTIENLRMFKTTFDGKYTEQAQVIQPVSIQCDVNVDVKGQVDDVITGSIVCSAVSIVLGNDVFKLLTKSQGDATSKSPEASMEECHNRTIPRRLSFKVNVETVTLEILQDWEVHKPPLAIIAMPLCKVNISEYSFEQHHMQRRIDGEVEIRMDVWNSHNGQWDSFFEPWLVHVSIDQPEYIADEEKDKISFAMHKETEQRFVARQASKQFIRVESPQIMNFNISASIVQRLNLLETFMDTSLVSNEIKSNVSDSNVFDFYMQNDSGRPLLASIVHRVEYHDPRRIKEHQGCWGWKAIPSGGLYHRRFFIVEGDTLKYFRNKKSHQNNKPAGIIPLHSEEGDSFLQFNSIVGAQHQSFPHASFCALQLVTPHRTYFIVTFTVDDKRELVAALLDSINKVKSNDMISRKHGFGKLAFNGLRVKLELEGSILNIFKTNNIESSKDQVERVQNALVSLDISKYCSVIPTSNALIIVCPNLNIALELNEEWRSVLCPHKPGSASSSKKGLKTPHEATGFVRISFSEISKLVIPRIVQIRCWLLPAGISSVVDVSEKDTVVFLSATFAHVSKNQYLKIELLDDKGLVRASGAIPFPHVRVFEDLMREELLSLFMVEVSLGEVLPTTFLGNLTIGIMTSENLLLEHQGDHDDGVVVPPFTTHGLEFPDEKAGHFPHLKLQFDQQEVVLDHIPISESGSYAVAIFDTDRSYNMQVQHRTAISCFCDQNDNGASKFLICDVFFERGIKMARLKSCVTLLNRLEQPLCISMIRLHPNVPSRDETDTSFFAFDSRVDTYWSSNTTNSNAVSYTYADHGRRTVLMYSIASHLELVASPTSWKLEGRGIDNEWIVLDSRSSILYSASLQVMSFDVANPASCSTYRVSFENPVVIANIILFSQERNLYGQTQQDAISETFQVKPQKRVNISLDMLHFGTACKFNDGNYCFLFDLLRIDPWQIRDPTPRNESCLYYPVTLSEYEYCVSRTSIHRLSDYAKSTRDGAGLSSMWLLTIDPPLIIENLLPFPFKYSIDTACLNHAPLRGDGEIVGQGNVSSFLGLSAETSEQFSLKLSLLKDDRFLDCEQVGMVYGDQVFSKTDKLKFDVVLGDIKFSVEVVSLLADQDDLDHQHGLPETMEQEYRPPSGLLPSSFVKDCLPTVKIYVYAPVMVFNWSGLQLVYADSNKKVKFNRKVVPMLASTRGLSTRSLKEQKKMVHVSLFSSEHDKMCISTEDSKYDWSRSFGLAVGMQGEIHIPGNTSHSLLHQVGVSIAAAPGRFLRTKMVTLTPRFMVVNHSDVSIQLLQVGTKTSQFHLGPQKIAPFHPVDVNGDGKLDDKDFSVQLSVYDDMKVARVSQSFRMDILKRFILPLKRVEDRSGWFLADCSNSMSLWSKSQQEDTLKENLVQTNIEYRENVVRILFSNVADPLDRSVEYRVDNLSPLVRLGIVQKGQSRNQCMRYFGPQLAGTEWIWDYPEGSRKVEVVIEMTGFRRKLFNHSSQRKHVIVDFDHVGQYFKVKLLDEELELYVAIKGVTKVLVVDTLRSTNNTPMRRVLSQKVQDSKRRIESAVSECGLKCGIERLPDKSCEVLSESTVLWTCVEIEPVLITGYSFLAKQGQSWKVFCLDTSGNWSLIDSQNFAERTIDPFVDKETGVAVFRFHPVYSSKLKLEFNTEGVDLSHVGLSCYKNKIALSTKRTFLWGCVMEAKDLSIKDLYTSDPYFSITYGQQKFATNVIDRNLNPLYDQEFCFGVDAEMLLIKCFDKDVILKDDFIGESVVPIAPFKDGRLHDLWIPLKDGSTSGGFVRLMLQFLSEPPTESHLSAVTFPFLLSQEIQLWHSLERLLRKEGGGISISKTHLSNAAFHQDHLADSHLSRYLSLTIMKASSVAVLSKHASRDMYCVVSYGDTYLRSDAVKPRTSMRQVAGPSTQLPSVEFECEFKQAGPLGIQICRNDDQQFVVLSVACDSQASVYGNITAGVRLMSVGNNAVTESMEGSTVRSLLLNSIRPIFVTFKTLPSVQEEINEMVEVEWRQQLNFTIKDTLRAFAAETFGLFGREFVASRICISIFAKIPENQPSINLETAESDEKTLLVPLMLLFGDDIETDAKMRRKAFGNNDVLVGETNILLPDVHEHGEHCRVLNSVLERNGKPVEGSLQVELGWVVVPESESEVIKTSIDVKLRGIGVSLIDKKRELLYNSIGDIRYYQGCHLDGRCVHDIVVGRIQIDNQTAFAVHPIIFCSSPQRFPWIQQEDLCRSELFSKSSIEKYNSDQISNPAFLLTLVTRDTRHVSISYVEYFDCYLQEMDLKLEERLLSLLQDFTSDLSTKNSQSAKKQAHTGILDMLDNHALNWIVSDEMDHRSTSEEGRILIERADIKPIRINLSFTMTADSSKTTSSRLKILHLLRGVPVLDGVASALVTTVANISDAPLQFNGLTITNENKTTNTLRATFSQHIRDQVLSNVATWTGNVIASADLLGSPVQLIGSFGQGAYSFFYEPAMAMSIGGYASVGRGLRRGGGELVRTSLHGLSYSLEKFAESVSRVLSQISLDRRYIVEQARRRNDVVNEPVNIGEGLVASSKALGYGMKIGIQGVVQQPYRGYMKGGSIGMMSGLGKGVLGAVLKPFVSMFDASALFLKGMSNQTDTMASQELPVRLRRYFNGSVFPYSVREAIGIEILKSMGLDSSFVYIYHQQVSTDKESILFLTNKMVFILSPGSLACSWCVPLEAVDRIRVEDGHLILLNIGQNEFKFKCRTSELAIHLSSVMQLSRSFKPWRSYVSDLDHRASLEAAVLSLTDPVGAQERANEMKSGLDSVLHPSIQVQSSLEELILGMSVGKAVVTGRRFVTGEPPGFHEYRIVVSSSESELCWVVWRRFSAFHSLRDRVARMLSKAKTSLPVPSRLPWRSLSSTSLNQRQVGLNELLKVMMQTRVIADLVDVRLFLTRNPTEISHEWITQ